MGSTLGQTAPATVARSVPHPPSHHLHFLHLIHLLYLTPSLFTPPALPSSQVLNGLRHGHGHMSFTSSPVVYEGEWQEGMRHGQGTLTFNAEGTNYYEGQLRRSPPPNASLSLPKPPFLPKYTTIRRLPSPVSPTHTSPACPFPFVHTSQASLKRT